MRWTAGRHQVMVLRTRCCHRALKESWRSWRCRRHPRKAGDAGRARPIAVPAGITSRVLLDVFGFIGHRTMMMSRARVMLFVFGPVRGPGRTGRIRVIARVLHVRRSTTQGQQQNEHIDHDFPRTAHAPSVTANPGRHQISHAGS